MNRPFSFGASLMVLLTVSLPVFATGHLPAEKARPAKTQRTFYTEERLAELENQLKVAVARADAFLEDQSPQDLWRLVPGQALPRSFAIHSRASSEVYASPEAWKVEVEIAGGKRLMPTNDFEAYYESGIDEQGWFDPRKADRSLLVNTLHPDKPLDWGVDDGWGWVDENGRHWTFIAHYMHWHRFIGVVRRIRAFRDAYLHTGDRRYARAGLVMMDRLADVYPELDTGKHDTRIFKNSNGGAGSGKMVGRFWEANHIREVIAAYDAFFPVVQEGDDHLVQILSLMAREYKLNHGKDTIDGIAKNIEHNIIRDILPSVKSAKIRGDHGNPSALAMAAVVLDEPDGYTREVLSFMMKSGGLERVGGEWRTTGGDILPGLVDRTDRDGHPETGAPQYNRIYVGRMRRAAEILAYHPAPPELNLAAHPKYLRMQESQIALRMLDRYVPTIGDTWRTGNPQGRLPGPDHSQNLAGYGFAALRDGSPDPGGAWPDDRRAAFIYYGRNAMRNAEGNVIAGGHAHRNALMLGVYGLGLDLTPDLGYPEQTGSWPKRINWTASTISHNTVLVDASRQEGQWVGRPRHFEAGELVKFIDVEAPTVYPQTQMYRRSTAMVRVDEKHSYLIDFFRVLGGTDHLFSFHGAEGPVATSGLDLIHQERGTYAGLDVSMPAHGEETEYNGRVRNGFNYLYDVRRDSAPGAGFSVEWEISDTWNVLPEEKKGGIRLRLTMLNDDLQEIALAHGEPPQHKGNPLRLNYMLARRKGEDLESCFTSVIEPYRHARFIEEIELLKVRDSQGGMVADKDVRAVRVILRNGTTDTIVQSVHPERRYLVDDNLAFQGVLGFRRENPDGQPVYAYLHAGAIFQRSAADPAAVRPKHAALSCRIVDFTREMTTENHILIDLPEAARHLTDLPGRWIYVDNDGWRNAAYEIHKAEAVSSDRIKLHLGNTTLIRQFADPHDFEKGYLYNIAKGAEARIPLSAEARLSKNP